MTLLDKETIQRAQNVDIVDFCAQNGYPLSQVSQRYYKGVEHDSLVIDRSKNTYEWYSTGQYGNAINFVQTFMGRDFRHAVQDLLADGYVAVNVKKAAAEPQPFRYAILHDQTTEAVEHYLCDVRGIDRRIVQTLIQKNMLKQDVRQNAVFVWGLAGQRVGAELQGTQAFDDGRFGHRTTFKQICANSEPNYGFNLSIGSPKRLYVFEAPIDLLSYWSLHKELNDCRLVSMDGLKPLTVEKMIQNTGQLYGMYPTNVQIGVDNDRAGQAFFDRLSKKIMATPDGERITFHSLIPFDKHLPKANLPVYQETAKRHGIDWQWIAAIHKVETNLSRTNELVNGFNYEAFFGRDLPKNHHPESIDLEKACERCAQHLERYTSEGQTNITDALINTKLPFEDKRGFERKVKSVYNWYLGGDFQTDDHPSGLPGKDWNDALFLQNNGNAREQDYPYKRERPVTARKTVSRMRA
ncbi:MULTISPECIES: DUF3991 and TOPRIM domain-containing protein [unclassified Sporolactobacillus]|uniref:DUF3991 and TOPRIM domain-containing protein n=1 Tax=unclassified Sporolactobacillus TaxID=2628533 RepID=UPI0023684D2F|nr:DUF3991 and TOPRIM domain-containing protein [Sporolactobacillus sp. CQH2019]MDD9150465.1 DUF3991 and TOPRIM domain-containing protein [Sporolactobacillus sp. CQH2019]